MQKTIYILFLAVHFTLIAYGQKISGMGDLQMKPIEKEIFDTAQVKVYYEYTFCEDSTKANVLTTGQTALLVGRNGMLGFMDNNSLMVDSINDAYCREERSSMEFMTKVMGMKKAYDYPLVINLGEDKATVCYDGLRKYKYIQALPHMQWELAAGDSTLSGVPCKRATCRFGGREWTAWYAPSYAMIPFGPYLFGGLPGLIFKVSDTHSHHTFELNGLENTVSEPIYLHKQHKQITASREDVRKAIANGNANPQKMLEMDGVTFGAGGFSVKSFPYNPIELE